MSLEFNGTEHLDKSKDISLSLTKGNLYGSASVSGYKDGNSFAKPTGPTYNSASTSIGAFSEAGHNAGMTATHTPNFGNQVTAAANVNVVNTDNHKLDVNAFSTRNFPKGPIPTFSTHGAGVNYQYKDVAQAAASVVQIPIAQRTDYSISTGLKLHETPTSSFSANIGASKTDSPFARGSWGPNAFFQYQKKF